MNTIIKNALFCIAIVGSLHLTSCSSELDIKPTAELENEFFDSEWRVQQGVGACYAGFANIYSALLDGSGAHPFWMLPGDDLTNKDAGFANMEAFSGLEANDGFVRSVWQRLYQIIYRTNFILEKLETPEIQELVTRQGLLDANKGEALFIRSWCFYKLWDNFRKAPIQDKRIYSAKDTFLPPTQGFEMLDKAISDLELAATLLPPASYWDYDTEAGRVFNESAYGLLVKCYTLRARYNNKNTEDYNKALTAFNKITTRQLVSFSDNFDYHFENNAESLFEFQAGHNIAQDNAWLDNNFGGGVGQMGAYYHYFTSHWANYQSGTYGPTKKLIKAFEEGDPRLEQTASKTNFTNIYGDINIPQDYGWEFFDGYQFQKYVRPGRCYFEPNWGLNSTNNYRLIRYADVKLLAAEAYLNTGNTAAALKEVNDIRERARRSTEDGTVSAIPADLKTVNMNDIMDERFRELAGEDGIRWSDLRSWHAAGFINLSTWKASDFGYNFSEKNFEFKVPKHLLFPIPQSEIDTNPLMSAEGNNPDY